MRPLQTRVDLARRRDYDGTQLSPHFIRSAFGLAGDAAVAFRGGCDVRGAALVDLEDRERDLFIHSRDMLHIMVERFDPDLERAVLLQRLLVALTADRIRGALAPDRAATVRRLGDDLFVGEGKLSVSVATLSPVSALIHLGLNIDDRGTPVRAAALGPLGIDPARLAADLLGDLAGELAGAAAALAKVAPAHPGGAAD